MGPDITTGTTPTKYGSWVDLSNSTSSSSATFGVDLAGEITRYGDPYVTFRIKEIPIPITPGSTHDLPDGSTLIVDDRGNYKIDDRFGKVTYAANRNRDFSPYLNASDMLAKFVEYVGSVGVRREEVMNLPIHLFISWLIIEAATRDGDPIPEDMVSPESDPAMKYIKHPYCLDCGRFIPKLHARNRFPFCEPDHASRYLEKSRIAIAG